MLFIIVEVFFFSLFLLRFQSSDTYLPSEWNFSFGCSIHSDDKATYTAKCAKRGKAKQWAKSEPHVTSEMGSPGSGV